jgi:uncharacterized protein involved in exopolysaccharide biosynthesis/Mrp family chromosome partitioning ATPase
VLKAYWLRLFLFAFTGGIIAAVISYVTPKKYEAVLDMMIDQKPITTSIPLNSAESSVSDLIDFSRPRSLQTTVQQLVSYGIVSQAANRVAAQFNQNEPVPGSGQPLDPVEVLGNLSVSAETASDVIGLRVRMTNREYAAAMVNEIYIAFIEQNRRNSTTLADQAIQSLKGQYDSMVAQLKEIDGSLKAERLRIGSPDVNASISADIGQLAALRQRRDSLALDVSGAQQRVQSLQSSLQSMEQSMKGGDSRQLNPNYTKLEQDMVQARSDLATLRERYTDAREEVKAARQRVWALEAAIKRTPKMVDAASSTTPDTARIAIRQGVADARAALDSSQSQLGQIDGMINAIQQRLNTYPESQSKIQELLRNQSALERLQLTYADRLKSLDAAKVGRLAPVSLVTTAVALPDPVSPKWQINLLLGTVGGLILGVLSMLATEAKRQPVRSLAQLNALALRPVYRMVPELRQPYRGLNKAPAEAYDSLLANYLRSGNRPYRIGIVGVTKDSGASTSAMNLAIAASRHGARVLLVQCDPRGGLSRMTGSGTPEAGKIAEISSLIKGISAESVLAVSNERNPELSAEIRQQEADITIVDLEPTTKSSEYAFLAPHVDEIILLVRAGRAKSVEFLQAQQALKESGCPLVTVAFTRSSDLSVVTEAVETEGAAKPVPQIDTSAAD